MNIYFKKSEIEITVLNPSTVKYHNIKFTFSSKQNLIPEGIGKSEKIYNFYVGKKAFSFVSEFDSVWYKDIYSNVDLKFYFNDKGIKYDFIVYPGGIIDDITITAITDLNVKLNPKTIEFYPKGDKKNITFHNAGRELNCGPYPGI